MFEMNPDFKKELDELMKVYKQLEGLKAKEEAADRVITIEYSIADGEVVGERAKLKVSAHTDSNEVIAVLVNALAEAISMDSPNRIITQEMAIDALLDAHWNLVKKTAADTLGKLFLEKLIGEDSDAKEEK